MAGRIDVLRPSYREPWGGPLNGQERRREIVRELRDAIAFDRVLETGAFRGSSTTYLASVFGTPVDTVESNPRSFAYSRGRLRRQRRVTVNIGDSRAFLRRLAAAPGAGSETVFVYLDAHWKDDLPLADELAIIASTWERSVVMVDDFEVPGDSGYGFDDYGEGKALVEAYLPMSVLKGWSLSYPSATSEQETGARRGCCILVSPALAAQAAVPGLRRSRVL